MGAVIELWALGAPATWMVLVVGLMVVWALAEKVANPSRIKRQNKTVADFRPETCLLCAGDATLIEGPMVLPSRLVSLGPEILIEIQEGVIQIVNATAARRYLRKVLQKSSFGKNSFVTTLFASRVNVPASEKADQ
ncbi:MAG: hypothetical protein ACXVKH_07550 [Candidatus Angelobacter sp.]